MLWPHPKQQPEEYPLGNIDDLEQRLATVEAEIVALREQATDTHTLAAHADRDVAEFRTELRAQTRLLNLTRLDLGAMRETQGEQSEKTDAQYAELKGDIAEVKVGILQIVGMLETLGGDGS